jgi:hypothetical protein
MCYLLLKNMTTYRKLFWNYTNQLYFQANNKNQKGYPQQTLSNTINWYPSKSAGGRETFSTFILFPQSCQNFINAIMAETKFPIVTPFRCTCGTSVSNIGMLSN